VASSKLSSVRTVGSRASPGDIFRNLVFSLHVSNEVSVCNRGYLFVIILMVLILLAEYFYTHPCVSFGFSGTKISDMHGNRT
jgi:hypothetical protein